MIGATAGASDGRGSRSRSWCSRPAKKLTKQYRKQSTNLRWRKCLTRSLFIVFCNVLRLGQGGSAKIAIAIDAAACARGKDRAISILNSANTLAGKYGSRQTIRRRQRMLVAIVIYHILKRALACSERKRLEDDRFPRPPYAPASEFKIDRDLSVTRWSCN